MVYRYQRYSTIAEADVGLTLERAKTAIHEKETITEQQTELGGERNPILVEEQSDHKLSQRPLLRR